MMLDRQVMIEALLRAYPETVKNVDMASGFLQQMIDKDQVICEKSGFAFYVKCNDEVLDKISKDKGYILDPIKSQELMSSKGNNIHIFAIVSIKNNKQGKSSILQGISDLIAKEQPKTVSWYNKAMSKFNIRRMLCQPQQ